MEQDGSYDISTFGVLRGCQAVSQRGCGIPSSQDVRASLLLRVLSTVCCQDPTGFVCSDRQRVPSRCFKVKLSQDIKSFKMFALFSPLLVHMIVVNLQEEKGNRAACPISGGF